jgi:very-short-patch-repair endonuclease
LDEYGIEYNDVYIGYEDRNEYYIKDGLNIYFYDFVIRSKKIIIEYNGIAFHPKLENIDFFKPILTKLSPIELYNKQKYKVELAEKNGFKVLEIWSDDVDSVSKCIEFIKNNIK